jgi:thiamine biosynthesis protein ThiS
MRIEVNGEPKEVPPDATIESLLIQLGLTGGPIAVERNTAIVPRAEHGATALVDGDRLEVVQFVGGG